MLNPQFKPYDAARHPNATDSDLIQWGSEWFIKNPDPFEAGVPVNEPESSGSPGGFLIDDLSNGLAD